MGNFCQIYPLLPNLPLPHAHSCMPITNQDSGARFEVPNSAVPTIYDNEQKPFQAFKRDRDQLIKILKKELDNFIAQKIEDLKIDEEEFNRLRLQEEEEELERKRAIK